MREKPQNLVQQKNQFQQNLSTPAQQNTTHGRQSDLQLTSWRERPTKERSNNNPDPKISREPTQMTAQDQHVPGDQGNCTTESHRVSTTEVYTINPGGQNRAT